MLARAAIRSAPKNPSAVARRGFQTSRAQFSSPYHYPEGPYTGLPFNAKSKWFPLGYWAFCIAGFGAPFGIAGESFLPSLLVDT
jgi:cytochrome c oxidase subunit 7c